MAKVSDEVVERYAGLLLTKSEELNKNVLGVEKHGRCIASSSAGDEVQTEWRALSKAVSLLMADLYMIGSKRGFAHKLDAALTPAGSEGWFSRLMKRFGC